LKVKNIKSKINIANINSNAFILLLISAPLSKVAGVLSPSVGLLFEPYLLIWLGILLFVNLIRLNPKDVLDSFAKPTNIVIMTFFKLLILPLGVYAITYFIYPKLALSATLLSGVSTAFGAPFAVNFIGRAKLSTMVGVIVVSSIAAPFTLPTIAYFLFKEKISIPIFDMIFLLAMALLIPLFVGWYTRKKAERLAKTINENSLSISLILIVLINLSVFANFSSYFFMNSLFVIELVLATFLLFGLYGFAGYYYHYSYYFFALITGRRRRRENSNNNNKGAEKEDKITGLLAMTYISNILVVVLAHQFFDIKTEALAAFYQIPYYGGLLLLKKLLV
jgi:BASS family bile acid:Na+ symporter